MTILLTGATGFLGSQLLASFVQKDRKVIISYRDPMKLKLFPPDIIKQVVLWDLAQCSVDALFKMHPNITTIVHAATDYGRDYKEQTKVFWANEAFPMQLLERAIQHTVKRFINLDTFFNTEKSKYQYLGAYTLSKQHFQEWGEYCANHSGLNFINMRLFHIFGPNDSFSKYVPSMIVKCLNGEFIDHTEGIQKRDFIHINDVVNAVNIVLDADLNPGYCHFDVGRGESVRLHDFVMLINTLCGESARINFGALPTREGEPMDTSACIAPLQSLGWEPKIGLEAGLLATIKAFKHG